MRRWRTFSWVSHSTAHDTHTIDESFCELQQKFIDEHCHTFEDEDENKHTYYDIFNAYGESVEAYVISRLEATVEQFSMEELTTLLTENCHDLEGDVFDLLLSFSDFEVFKELMLASKHGTSLSLDGLIVTSQPQSLND